MTPEQIVNSIIKANSVAGASGRVSAEKGTLIIDDSNPHNDLEAYGFIAQTNTVIMSCTGVDATGAAIIDFKTTFNWSTIYPGIPILAPTGFRIKTITLTSGSIALYS